MLNSSAGGGFLAGGTNRRKVLARGETAVVHVGTGAITTNVDLTAYDLPDILKCYEKLTGITTGAAYSTGYYGRLSLTSPTNLEITTYAATAMTIRVKWEVVKSEGTVQRGTEAIAVSASEVKSDITITAVNVTYAKARSNGATPSGNAIYPVDFSVEITTATNLESYASTYAAVTITGAWVVDGG